MKHLRIGILMRDADFKAAFLAKANKQYPGTHRLSFFDTTSANDISLLLTDCKEAYHAARKDGAACLLLTEQTSPEDPTQIYKYSGANDVFSRILSLCGQESKACLENASMKTIGVLSSSGGTGCSFLAQHLAQHLQNEQQKSVFFLTMDDFEDPNLSKAFDGNYGIREFLYFEETGKQLPIESFLVSDAFGIVSFRHSKGRNPLPQASAAALKKVLVRLAESGLFDVLVADIGSGLSEGHLAMIEEMQETVFVEGAFDRRYLSYLAEEALLEKSCYTVRMTEEDIEDFAPAYADKAAEIAEELMI